MPAHKAHFITLVRAVAGLNRTARTSECYRGSNGTSFLAGGFRCGIPNLEGFQDDEEGLAVCSQIRLPKCDIYTALIIQSQIATVRQRLATMKSDTRGEFFSDNNKHVAFLLSDDGKIYLHNKGKDDEELTPELKEKLGPGIEPDAFYWQSYGEETPAAKEVLEAISALAGKEKFRRAALGIREAFLQLCEFCRQYEAHGEPWKRDDPRVDRAHTALASIQLYLESQFSSYSGQRFQVETAKGAGNFPYVPWVCLLPPEQSASNGVFVSICFGHEGNGAVAGFAESVKHRKGLNFVARTESKLLRVDVDGGSDGTHYNDSFANPKDFYPESFDEAHFKRHLEQSLDMAIQFLGLDAAEPFSSKHKAGFLQQLKDSPVCFKVTESLPERFLTALAAKPFVILTGNSGTGKTKLAELFAQWLCGTSKDRYALVPVGADWTDNRNVLGFVNHISRAKPEEEQIEAPTFQSTRILDLLLEASRKENEDKPFFLILDEMNLSHVERYFADFLSAMESKDRELLLHSEGRSLSRRPGSKAEVDGILPLPRNVFVIGTVNVDETTYMFSPKVLDRANVIEFRMPRKLDDNLFKSVSRPVGDIAAAPAGYAEAFLTLSHRARGIDATPLSLLVDPDNPPPDAKNALATCGTTVKNLFQILQSYKLEFGFRPMAEITRYLAVDYELAPDKTNWEFLSAMDAQILQKILPKLHGSRKRIEALLIDLARYCETGKPHTEATVYRSKFDTQPVTRAPEANPPEEDSPPEKGGIAFRHSYHKLCDMIDAVRRDQFVSFI